MALYILLGVTAFCFMEFVAWSNHKYIMHGFLWNWHKDHHRRDSKKDAMPLNTESKHFEKNDRFFIMYATPAIILLILGFTLNYPAMIAIGIGISVYGLTYFLIHDVIIHQRLPFHFLNKYENKYINAIRNAHLSHHRPKTEKDFHIYGLLVFPRRFLKQ
mgnify:CR=1 FL=1